MHEEQLAAYLARIGVSRAEGADLETLTAVQRAHRLAITFENLDIPLGRGISLAAEAVLDKLVTRRRGGYCFEQNSLLLAALRAIGFEARPLLARVWLLAEHTPPQTHTLNLVTLDGTDYAVDAGFGGSYVPPLPLVEDEPVTTEDGARHRLVREAEHGWMLDRDPGTGWGRQYSFTLAPVWPIDLEMANHFTATRPCTRFTTLRIASRTLPDGYASLVDRTLTISRKGVPEAREIESAGEYRAVLAETFALDLSPAEIEALKLF
jgi:N-hydroxyarylamine O-acetyltransferase